MSGTTIEIATTDQDAEAARAASLALIKIIQSEPSEPIEVHLHASDEMDTRLILPLSAIRLLSSILQEMAKGNGISIVPFQAELSLHQAADMLNVSLPYLIQLLDEEKIPFNAVGTHRRIKLRDMLEYIRDYQDRARNALSEMTAEAQALGLY